MKSAVPIPPVVGSVNLASSVLVFSMSKEMIFFETLTALWIVIVPSPAVALDASLSSVPSGSLSLSTIVIVPVGRT